MAAGTGYGCSGVIPVSPVKKAPTAATVEAYVLGIVVFVTQIPYHIPHDPSRNGRAPRKEVHNGRNP